MNALLAAILVVTLCLPHPARPYFVQGSLIARQYTVWQKAGGTFVPTVALDATQVIDRR